MLYGVLGPLEVRDRGATVDLGAGKPAILLSALLLNANKWVSLDQLIGVTWQETAAPASAARNISTYVWQLRRQLGADRIDGRTGGYRLRVQPGELDAQRFERHATAAEHARAAGDLTAELTALEAAGRLWRGQPYRELTEPAAVIAAARLGELHFTLRADRAAALVRAGRGGAAAILLRELTAEDPLRERPWALLVRALHAAGRRAEALATFRRARTVLVDELGVEPGPELAAAHRDALREAAPAADWVSPQEVAAVAGVDVAAVERVLACLQQRALRTPGRVA